MKVKKFLIAGGNSTALIYNSPLSNRGAIAKEFLKNVEQVGFVSSKTELPTLIMMGEELCINATISFASTLNKHGKLTTSGLKNPVSYSNLNGSTTIQIPSKFKRDKNVVLLEGIGFILYDIKEKSVINKSELSKLSKKYELPAFGGIIYKGNEIIPYVYVLGIDSFVRETACGSGSIAFSIYSGINKIIQPTKQTITISKKNNFFDISAKVTSID